MSKEPGALHVQPGLRRRRRVGRNEAGIAVGKCHDEKMRPILDAGDDRIRRAKVRLSRARRMGQRHKHRTPTKAPFPNVILHDGLFAREAMFVAKALEYTLRRVVLLTVNRSVLLQNTVDDIREGGQFRAFRWLASPISRRCRMPQHLPHRRARNAKPTCRLSLAQTINGVFTRSRARPTARASRRANAMSARSGATRTRAPSSSRSR